MGMTIKRYLVALFASLALLPGALTTLAAVWAGRRING